MQNRAWRGDFILGGTSCSFVSAFLRVMFDVTEIDWNDWPKMMEGVFLWFDDKPFEQASAYLVWRGEVYVRPIHTLLDGYRAAGFHPNKLLLPPEVKWT